MSARKVDIDWEKVGKLLNAQCSGSSIATMLGIHENTLYDRCRTDLEMEFMAFSQKKKAEGVELLKAKQFDVANSGNATMLIWLGKQILGQRDKVEQTVTMPGLQIIALDEEERNKLQTAFEKIDKQDAGE
jgi:hypothetical protein